MATFRIVSRPESRYGRVVPEPERCARPLPRFPTSEIFFSDKFRVLAEMQGDIAYQGAIGITDTRTHRRVLSELSKFECFRAVRDPAPQLSQR
jgi:hypothetical protein